MTHTVVLASYKQVMQYGKLAVEYCVLAEASFAAGMMDAHDLTLMAVGAAGVAVMAANEAVDANAMPVLSRRAVELASEAVERVQWVLAAHAGERLEQICTRSEGHRMLVQLASEQLRLRDVSDVPELVN